VSYWYSIPHVIIHSDIASLRFRWVFCQLNALKTCRKESTLRQRLDQLPKDLDETYDRILQNIMDEDADEAFAALQWLAYSERPLSLDELAEAIVVQPDKYSLDSRDRLLDPYEVLHICSSLVVLNNEDIQERDEEYDQYTEPFEEHTRKVVSFAHFSIKEYLTSDRIRQGPASRFAVSGHTAHAFIGQACLSYLLAFDRDDSLTEDPFEAFPLIEYAGRSWPNHVRLVENNPEYSEKTTMLALELLHSKPYAFLNWLRVSDPDWQKRNYLGLPRLDYDFHDIGPPIYYASFLHLRLVAKALIESGADVNEKGGGFGHALHAALCPLKSRTEFRREAVGQLGEVQLGTRDSRTIMVQLLLDYGADIEAENGFGYSVLYVAVANGQEEVVRLLINMGANVETRPQHGMTVLMNAALYGREEIARLLLDEGADIEAEDERDGRNGATVLCGVARFGNRAMVQLLLERGANITAKDDKGRTALHYATQDGRKDTVQLLLERRADIAARDNSERTALHYAAVNGDEEVIQLLLEKGAEISAKDDKGQTALHLAAIERRGEAVKLLIDSGADIREEDSAGCTALQYATSKPSETRVKVSVKALPFDAVDTGR
jgi:ankyrin repeat domain-containing protein 50